MSRPHRLSFAACAQCDEIFGRRASDMRPGAFCSTACRNASFRTGRSMVDAVCAGCRVGFSMLRSDFQRRRTHYCTAACYRQHVDYAALGRAGGGSVTACPEVRLARARAGGLARARTLSKDRLHEIARLGVEARLARREEVGRKISMARRFGTAVALGVRLGKRQR